MGRESGSEEAEESGVALLVLGVTKGFFRDAGARCNAPSTPEGMGRIYRRRPAALLRRGW